jgi:hypothetical protein
METAKAGLANASKYLLNHHPNKNTNPSAKNHL